MKISLSDLQYYVFPGQFCRPAYLRQYEQTFKFWLGNWSAVVAELKATKIPSADDFFRQAFVCALFHKSKVFAAHLYSFYDLRLKSIIHHSYLKHNFNEEYLETCRSLNFSKGMTMESLFVDPNYRKSVTGVPFTDIIVSLGQKVFLHKTDAQVILAPARVENKVSRSACSLGFEPVQSGVFHNNVLMDLLICRREKIVPAAPEALFYVEHLWKSHIDASQDKSGVRAA